MLYMHYNCRKCKCPECADTHCKLKLDVHNNMCHYCADLDGDLAEETQEKSESFCRGYISKTTPPLPYLVESDEIYPYSIRLLWAMKAAYRAFVKNWRDNR